MTREQKFVLGAVAVAGVAAWLLVDKQKLFYFLSKAGLRAQEQAAIGEDLSAGAAAATIASNDVGAAAAAAASAAVQRALGGY